MPNWDTADKDIVAALVRDGDAYLQAQITLATSADQRAAVLGGIFAASGTAVIAGLMVAPSDVREFVLVAGFATGFIFLLASSLCLITALPRLFHLPANEPENWYSDVDANTPLARALGDVADDIQRKIVSNNSILQLNARLFFVGALLGIASPLVGLLISIAPQPATSPIIRSPWQPQFRCDGVPISGPTERATQTKCETISHLAL